MISPLIGCFKERCTPCKCPCRVPELVAVSVPGLATATWVIWRVCTDFGKRDSVCNSPLYNRHGWLGVLKKKNLPCRVCVGGGGWGGGVGGYFCVCFRRRVCKICLCRVVSGIDQLVLCTNMSAGERMTAPPFDLEVRQKPGCGLMSTCLKYLPGPFVPLSQPSWSENFHRGKWNNWEMSDKTASRKSGVSGLTRRRRADWLMAVCYSNHWRRHTLNSFVVVLRSSGAGIAQWLEHRTRDWKVAGSNPCWNGGRIFFSRVDFLCWLLFRYPFHPRVTTVARKKSRSFCQKCRWQVTAKHAYTLRMWILLNRASALVTTCP